MGNTAVDIVMREVTEYQVEVESLKIKIADCAIKALSAKPDEVNIVFDSLCQMAKLIDEVKPKEAMLNELFKTKLKIEDAIEMELNPPRD